MKKNKTAKENALYLLNLANKTENENLKKRYVYLAFKISSKYLLRLRRDFCPICGKRKKIRIKNKKIIRFCKECKNG